MGADDTALGRPPRHARPSFENDEAEPLGRQRDTPAVSGSVTCAGQGCRKRVKIDVPAGTMPLLTRIAQRQLAGESPILCSACDDETEEREAQRLEAEEQAERVKTRMDLSGIPQRWRAVTFDGLERDERADAIQAAEEWGSGKRRRGLLLWGKVGRGKSAIAAAAAVARLDLQHVRWVSVAALLKDLRMPFDSAEYSRAQRTLDAAGSGRRALVLDDLDKSTVTDHALAPLYVAIEGWVAEDLPLLVTMNRDIDALQRDFGERYGESIASRLAGHCAQFEVTGRDRRVNP
jgi:DNA replication protein DnaC